MPPLPSVETIIERLGLQPHPEGGFFRETYRSGESVAPGALPGRYRSSRLLGTAIYYLITPGSFSMLHRVASDEVFHFYLGDPVIQLLLEPGGTSRIQRLGTRLELGEEPQRAVPRGVWQGSILAEGGAFALLGATVAPGFEYEDFEMGNREELLRQYPAEAEWIRRLTPPGTE